MPSNDEYSDSNKNAYAKARKKIDLATPETEYLALGGVQSGGEELNALREIPASLSRLRNLRELDLSHTEISDISILSEMTALTYINLDFSKVEDLSPLTYLVNLTHLIISNTQVSTIEPILKLDKIEFLSLSNTKIKNIDSISELSNLKNLSVNGTSIESISEIRSLKNLISIDLGSSNVNSFRPLLELSEARGPDHGFNDITFSNTPPTISDAKLRALSHVSDPDLRVAQLLETLAVRRDEALLPPRHSQGPQFTVDEGTISLVDPNLQHEDQEQLDMQNECRIKVQQLVSVVDQAANTSPMLPNAVRRYQQLIQRIPEDIGARAIWSPANTMEMMLEVHEYAVLEGRMSEELPSIVAHSLTDLLQTHRVWFLGHPNAREVQSQAKHHLSEPFEPNALARAGEVVEAARESGLVDDSALFIAVENIQTARSNALASRAALGEAMAWAWNLSATVLRHAWRRTASVLRPVTTLAVLGVAMAQAFPQFRSLIVAALNFFKGLF